MYNLEEVLVKIRNKYEEHKDILVFAAQGISIISDFIIENDTISQKDVNFLETEFDIMIDNIIKEKTLINKLPEHNRNKVWEYVKNKFGNNYYYCINKHFLLKELPEIINLFGY